MDLINSTACLLLKHITNFFSIFMNTYYHLLLHSLCVVLPSLVKINYKPKAKGI